MEEPQQKTKQKGRYTAPMDRQIGKGKDPIAYTLKDKVFGELKVLNTANAWWLDPIKVENLIAVYKMDGTNEEACVYAGIGRGQLEYFEKLHPDFSGVKAACRELPILTARQTINKSLTTDLNSAWKYLERKKKKEFGANIDVTSDGERLPEGNVIVFENFEVEHDTETTNK